MLGFFSRSVTLGICTIMPLLALGACSADKGEASQVDGEDAGSVEQGVTSDLACDDASFTGSITGGFLSDSPFIRVNKTPENYSAFNNDCYNPAANGECWGEPRYQYAATFLNIKEWRGKICGKALETLTQTHVVHYTPNGVPSTITQPPWIAFERKKAGAPEYEWQPLKSDGKTAAYDLALNKVQSYQWSWHTTEPSDYRIVVRYAMPKDQFDFMMDKR